VLVAGPPRAAVGDVIGEVSDSCASLAYTSVTHIPGRLALAANQRPLAAA